MPRRPHGRTARTAWLKARITREGLAALDAARGATSRSTIVRDAVGHQIGRVTAPWTDTGDPHLAERSNDQLERNAQLFAQVLAEGIRMLASDVPPERYA